jgi:DNA-binding CsgD family transcriptional regulator
MATDKTDQILSLIGRGYSKKEISRALNVSEKVVSFTAKTHGLKLAKAYSHGQDELVSMLKELFPYLHLITEHHVGSGLRIDIYIPSIKLGFEFDGKQHDTFVSFFHKDEDGFIKSKQRDNNKDLMCVQKGIKLKRYAKVPDKKELFNYVTEHIHKNI